MIVAVTETTECELVMLERWRSVVVMDLAEMIEYCMSLPEVEQTTPFGPDVLVYKVAGKMFAVTDPQRVPVGMNLKCDPDRALDLRDQYDAVQPGWHMNKRHWNTVELNPESVR